MAGVIRDNQHGKSRVRLGRTWRMTDGSHVFVEMMVQSMIVDQAPESFTTESCARITATDTQKNIVYHLAKQFASPFTPEEFAVAMGRLLVETQPNAREAKVTVEMKPWRRMAVDGVPHEHAFSLQGTEVRTAYADVFRSGKVVLEAGFKELRVLKTTQSGFEGFVRDKYTTLPEARNRIVATSVTTTWRYATLPADYDRAYAAARSAMVQTFFGPPKGGVYSPSVQYTLFRMANSALAAVPEIDSVFLNMPNLHFHPVSPVACAEGFDNDVFVATSEPHGNIEAVVTRGSHVDPHCKL